MINFDVSIFYELGSLLFNTVKNLFSMLNFDFGGFTVNGYVLLIGAGVFGIGAWFIGRVSE